MRYIIPVIAGLSIGGWLGSMAYALWLHVMTACTAALGG